MRADRVRLSILAVGALLVAPCSALAQTTSTDAAIAELRQLLADQRTALDRQARIIEEQGQRLAALQVRVEAGTPTTAAAQAPLSEQPASRTAAEPTPDLPAMVVSAGEFPGSIRIPGTESAFKLGGQARLVAVHTLSALGTEDRFVTSSIPVGLPRAGEEARTRVHIFPRDVPVAIEASLRTTGPKRTETQRFITDRFDRFFFQVSQLQSAVRSGLVRKEDVQFPLEWYVEKRICHHKKLVLAYMAEYSTIESKQFFESLDAWQRCPSE